MKIYYDYEFSIYSNLNIVKKVVNKIISKISIYLNDEELFDIKLIINELLANSIIHGNKLDLQKKVYIRIIIYNKYIEISIRDQGEGIVEKSVYDYKEKRNDGRGLIIVKALSDNVVVKGNEIVIIKNISMSNV